MSAMEKMVAGMLGITPAEMSAMMTGFQDLLKNLSATLAEIKAQGEANAATLAAIMERQEDDGSKRSGSAGRKRLPASSGGPDNGSGGIDAGSGGGNPD